MQRRLWLLIFYFFCQVVSAAELLYAFDTASDKQRFQTWITQVRCIVCQGQNLSESSVPLAMDLKQKIAELIRHQTSDEEIKHYLVTRYGERILFMPSMSAQTGLLWMLPIIAMAGCVYRIVRRS